MTTATPMPWIKVPTSLLDDRKFSRLDKVLKWQYIELYLLAGQCDAEGYLIQSDEVLTAEDIAWRFRTDAIQLEEDMSVLQSFGLIDQDGYGAWFITDFEECQDRPQHEKRKVWRERKKQQRDAQKELQPSLPELQEESMNEIHAESLDDSPNRSPMGTPDDTLSESPACSHACREEESRLEKRREEEIGLTDSVVTLSVTERSSPGMTDGQKYWLNAFNRKRFSNTKQREAVLALERDYPEAFVPGVDWAAKQGMGTGKAIISLEKALPKWNKPKSKTEAGTVTISGL